MHLLIETHRAQLLAPASRRGINAVRVFGPVGRGDAGAASDVDLLVTLAPGGLSMDAQELLGRRVDVLTEADAVIRNLQTLTESSQRLSDAIKATEPAVPWRALAGFRNVIVHSYLGGDRAAVWVVIEKDLPARAEAVQRMEARLPA